MAALSDKELRMKTREFKRRLSEGETLVLLGSDFGGPAPTSRVVLGGTTECPTISWSDTRIEVRAPAFTQTTYLGVVKHGVSSNGVWLTPRAGR